MNSKFQNVGCCKSYTLSGIDGGELSISETVDRLAIEIRIRPHATAQGETIRLHKDQFDALCGMNSAYDGLEVQNPPASKLVRVAEEPDDEPAEALQ